MTESEFRDCLRIFCVHFPDWNKWARSLSEKSKQAWAGMFEDIPKTDLMAVVEKYKRGDIPPINAYEREQTAVKMLGHCHDIRRDREDRQRKRRHTRNKGVEGGVGGAMINRLKGLGCLDALLEIERRLADGEDHADILEDIRPRILRGEI